MVDPIIIIPLIIFICILLFPRCIWSYMDKRKRDSQNNGENNENENNNNENNENIIVVQGEIVEEEYTHLYNIRQGIVI